MISPVGPNSMMPRSAPPVFNEGAASTAAKVVSLVATLLVSLGSFLFLPAEAALMISAGAAALLSMLCCIPNNPAADRADRPQRWYQPIFNAWPAFFNRNQIPVVHVGPRVPVGGNDYPQAVPVALAPNRDAGRHHGEHVQAGRGHRLPGAVGVMPQAWVDQRRPANVQQVVDHPPGGPRIQQGRVPVGHGHQ